MVTYDGLQKLIRDGDALAEPDDKVTFDPTTGITIEAPINDLNSREDLRIVIEGDRLALYYRDGIGKSNDPDGPMHGRDWQGPVYFANYEDLNGFVYTMI